MEQIKLKWERPDSIEYPKIWHTFKAKDISSDKLVEYRIQDLPESHFENVLQTSFITFCRDEPLCEAYGTLKHADAMAEFKVLWESVLNQRMVLACFREGSNDLVGVNMNYVNCKNDKFLETYGQNTKSEISQTVLTLIHAFNGEFEACEQYSVDKYLTSLGLVVDGKYRGRGIGEQFLRSRKNVCQAFGIKVTSTIFTSNFSNKIADKAGFELNKSQCFDEMRKVHPEMNIPPIRSDEMTIKSIAY